MVRTRNIRIRALCSFFVCPIASLSICTPAAAQDDFSDRTELITVVHSDLAPDDQSQRQRDAARARTLEQRAVDAFNAGEIDQAGLLFDELRLIEPTNPRAHYNLACVRAQQGHLVEAEALLTDAIKHGFDDLDLLRRDPSLQPLHERPLLGDLIQRWDEVLAARRTALVGSIQAWMHTPALQRSLPAWRVIVLSAHDEPNTDLAVADLKRVHNYTATTIFGDPTDADATDTTPWVVVVLPDRRDYARWARIALGGSARHGFSTVGGAYDHDRKTLVAQDLGATLRHEFFHVLHRRDMSRRAQQHAIWVQEGLAALVEDYDLGGSGEFIPAPSWRTNSVARLMRAGRLMPISKLASLDQHKFTARRPLARYAHARAVFEYLAAEDKLASFYRAYTDSFATDPTGVAALEAALDQPIDRIERAFRAWLEQLEPAPETGKHLAVTMGIEVEEGTGSGPRVVSVDPITRRTTGIGVGSTITTIDARPVRELKELIRVLGRYKPHDTITVGFYRGKKHQTAELTLRPR